MADITQATTVDVEVGGITYTFKVPSIADTIKLAMAERVVRRKYDPDGAGDLAGLPMDAYYLIRGCAIMEQLTVAATDDWMFSKGELGQPVVDHTKFPDKYVDVIPEIAIKFDDAVKRFRDGGDSIQRSGEKAVESGGHSGAS